MAYGLIVRGSHGVVQIDQTYLNLFVKASGTANIGTTASQGLGSLVTLPIGVTITPSTLIAFSGSTPVALVSHGTSTIDVFSPWTDGSAFNWWVFDKLDGVATSGYGFWVKKPGTLEPVFDSTKKPMRVLGTYNVPGPGFSGGMHGTSGGITGNQWTGKTLGWANMNLATTTWSGPDTGQGPTTNYFYAACPYASAQAVNYTIGRFTTFQGGANTSLTCSGAILALDMTGY